MEDEAGQEISAGRPHIIERPRLTRLLDETSARMIMLVAPAGYGKTTLARQWLADRTHAWYQGGASSADVAALALGLADAADELVPDAGRRLREWLPTSREPALEVEVIAQFLTEDLEGWPDEAWFVIDDYHLLSSEAAEDLMRRLFASGERRLLLTSRQRPTWSTARDLLYGNFFELGQSSLAMSLDEASAILSSKDSEAASGLFALADGWPAVIGLAALTPGSVVPGEEFPEELHDYFAEELFASLPESTRDGLSRLALVPIVTRESAEAILENSTDEVLADARGAGMFSAQRGVDLTFHPLLRTFLMRKLFEFPRQELDATVARATDFLIQTHSWDEAFSLISDFGRHDLLDTLFASSLIDLTKQGRLATLREWLDYARDHDMAFPSLDLAEAELAFRQGVHERTEMLADTAAKALDFESPLKSAAHFLAGQSSYLLDETSLALRHFEDARGTARTSTDSRNALWGQFLISLELERPDVSERLRDFATVGPQDRDTRIRTLNGRLVLAIRKGGLAAAVSDATSAVAEVRDATDPVVRSSFWHIYAVALSLTGNYQLALEAVVEGLTEVNSSNMEFARPHILLSQASANIGLNRFGEGDAALTEGEELALQRGDDYVLTNAKTVRCRLMLQSGSPQEALAVISRPWARAPSRCMQAEFLLIRAATHACLGELEAAQTLSNDVQGLSTYLEPQLLLMWVRAMCALSLEKPEARSAVRAAFDHSLNTGAIDSFVFAYRLSPQVLQVLVEDETLHRPLTTILWNAKDDARARQCGLNSPATPDDRTTGGLTKREKEVYALIAEGKTNREIATELVITEVTAKVHVRNVLRKLGVRSRIQAALKAAREESGR